MLLWRLSTRQYANIFDGGYGLLFDGRWNTVGHAVTYRSRSTPLLQVPSAIVPLEGSPDRNVLINHTHPDSAAIEIASSTLFALDARLL